MDIFKQLFELGGIWAALIIITPFLIAVLAQRHHEKGKKWARPLQWIMLVLYVSALIYFTFVYK